MGLPGGVTNMSPSYDASAARKASVNGIAARRLGWRRNGRRMSELMWRRGKLDVTAGSVTAKVGRCNFASASFSLWRTVSTVRDPCPSELLFNSLSVICCAGVQRTNSMVLTESECPHSHVRKVSLPKTTAVVSSLEQTASIVRPSYF